MDAWTYIWLIAAGLPLAICIFFYFRYQHRRKVAIRALAVRFGFRYLGSALPRILTLSGTPLGRATLWWNVMFGERNGIRVIAFDCRFGSRCRRTVIAAEASTDVFGATTFNTDLAVGRSGDWMILYQRNPLSLIEPSLMPVAEIEAHLNAITS